MMLSALYKKWSRGLAFSIAVHACLVGGLLYFIHWREMVHPLVVDLDLSQLPSLPRSILPRGHAAPPPKAWVAPKTGENSAPQALTESAEEEAIPCPPPCPETPGDYVPAGMVSQEPRPIGVLLTDEDYPRQARKRNQAGKVVLEVFIDGQGGVREVRLKEGGAPELNEVALRKLKEARFSPARDAFGNAVPCKLVLPIRFELE
jgi:periplasmic protein TonB